MVGGGVGAVERRGRMPGTAPAGTVARNVERRRTDAEIEQRGPHDRTVQRSMTSTPIVVGDAIYGLNSYAELRGVDAPTSERRWSSDRLVPEDRCASSHLVQHQGRAFISVETGELVIARFKPAGYEEVDRTHLMTPTTRTRGGGSNRWRNVDRAVLWAHPAFANATSSRAATPRSSACR